MILCDGNNGLCAYDLELVHTREPKRSRVTKYYTLIVKGINNIAKPATYCNQTIPDDRNTINRSEEGSHQLRSTFKYDTLLQIFEQRKMDWMFGSA